MGEIAEMMLDGTLCEGCGVYLDGETVDYPRLCHGCAQDRRKAGRVVEPNGKFYVDGGERKSTPTPKKVICPTCNKRVKAAGLSDHHRDKHEKEV